MKRATATLIKIQDNKSVKPSNLCNVISGNYTCEVEWIGSPISITHKLTVLVPPSIVAVLPGGLGQVDHPIEAREGSQVRLECRAQGIPTPIVRWRSPVSTSFHYCTSTITLFNEPKKTGPLI